MTEDPEEEFQTEMRMAGITKKGEPLAREVWRLLPLIFAHIDADEDPMDVLSVIYRLANAKATALVNERRKKRQLVRRSAYARR